MMAHTMTVGMDNKIISPDTTFTGTGPFRSLSVPSYRLLWGSGICRYAAMWMELTILGWLALEITDSPFKVILVGVYRTIPYALVGPFSGLIGEQISRKLIIRLAAIASVISSSVLAVLIIVDGVLYWHIAVTAAILGAAVAFEFPARRALTRELVGSRMVVNAISLDIIGFTLSNIAGAALGGALIAWIGPGWAFSMVVFAYAFNVLLLIGLIDARQMVHKKTRLFGDMKETFIYIRQNPVILGVLITTVAANLLAFPFILFFPVFARDILGVGPALLGLMTAAFGIGTLIGSVLLASLVAVRRPGATFVGATALMTVTTLFFAASKDYGFSIAMLLLAGLGMSGFAVFQTALLLVVTSEEFRARVMGILSLAIGSGPLGMLIVGLLARWLGVPWAVGLAEGAMLVVLVAVVVIYRPLLGRTQEG